MSLRDSKQDRLPARRSVFVQNRCVYKQCVFRRLAAIGAVDMAEAMQARFESDDGAAQCRAACSAVKYALWRSVTYQNIHIAGNLRE